MIAKRQVSLSVKAAYGMGQSLLAVKNMLFHFFFLYFFSNVIGVSELLVVAATMIALVVDAFTDPIMGQVSDNYRSKKWGRRHKFMLWGIFPTMAALYLLFIPPDGLGQAGLFAWMLTFLIIVRIGLTIYGVPYASLGAELSTDYDERTTIISVREFFNNLFSVSVFVVGLLIFLPETPEFEDGMLNKAGYAPFVLTMAIIGVMGALIATFGTRHKIQEIRRYSDDERTRWTATFSQIRIALTIKPFLWLCGGYSLALILYGAASALAFYIGGYLWQFSQVQKFLIAVSPTFLLIPAVVLASVLSSRLDKRAAISMFTGLFFIASALPFVAYYLDLAPPIGSPALLLFVCLCQGLTFMGLTGVIVISNSMLADVADVMELQTTKRQEGVLYAVFSFAQKLTFIFGTLIASLSLMYIGFPKQTKPSDVPQDVINGLASVSILTALIFGLAGLFCYRRYALTRQSIQAVQAELRERAHRPALRRNPSTL